MDVTLTHDAWHAFPVRRWPSVLRPLGHRVPLRVRLPTEEARALASADLFVTLSYLGESEEIARLLRASRVDRTPLPLDSDGPLRFPLDFGFYMALSISSPACSHAFVACAAVDSQRGTGVLYNEFTPNLLCSLRSAATAYAADLCLFTGRSSNVDAARLNLYDGIAAELVSVTATEVRALNNPVARRVHPMGSRACSMFLSGGLVQAACAVAESGATLGLPEIVMSAAASGVSVDSVELLLQRVPERSRALGKLEAEHLFVCLGRGNHWAYAWPVFRALYEARPEVASSLAPNMPPMSTAAIVPASALVDHARECFQHLSRWYNVPPQPPRVPVPWLPLPWMPPDTSPRGGSPRAVPDVDALLA